MKVVHLNKATMAPRGFKCSANVALFITIVCLSSKSVQSGAQSAVTSLHPKPEQPYSFTSDEQNGADSVGAVIRKYPRLTEPLPDVNYSLREQQSLPPEHNDSLNGLMLSSVLAAPMANYELASSTAPVTLPPSTSAVPQRAVIPKYAGSDLEGSNKIAGQGMEDSNAAMLKVIPSIPTAAAARAAPMYDTVTGAVDGETIESTKPPFVLLKRDPEDNINDLLIGANYTVVNKRSVARSRRRSVHPMLDIEPVRKIRHYKREVSHWTGPLSSEEQDESDYQRNGGGCRCCKKHESFEEDWDCANYYPLFPWDQHGGRQYYYSSSNKYVVPRDAQPKIAVRPLLQAPRKSRSSICSYQNGDDLEATSHYGCAKHKRQSLPAAMVPDQYVDMPVAVPKRREMVDLVRATTAAIYWNPPARKEKPQNILQRIFPENFPSNDIFSGPEPAPTTEDNKTRLEKVRQDPLVKTRNQSAMKSSHGSILAQAKTMWKTKLKEKLEQVDTPAAQSLSTTSRSVLEEMSFQRIPVFGTDSKEAAFMEAVYAKNKLIQEGPRVHETAPAPDIEAHDAQERPHPHLAIERLHPPHLAAADDVHKHTHSHHEAINKGTAGTEDPRNAFQAQQNNPQDADELLPVGTILFNIFGKKKDAELIYNNKLNKELEVKASEERTSDLHAKSAEVINRGPGVDSSDSGGGFIAKMQALLQDALKVDQVSDAKLMPSLYVHSQLETLKSNGPEAVTPNTNSLAGLQNFVTDIPVHAHQRPSSRVSTTPAPRTKESASKIKSTPDLIAKHKHMSMLRAVLCGNACTPSTDRFGKMRKVAGESRWIYDRKQETTSTSSPRHQSSAPHDARTSPGSSKVESVSMLEKILMKAAHMDTVDTVQLKEGLMDLGQQTRTKRKGVHRDETPYVFEAVPMNIKAEHAPQHQYKYMERLPVPQHGQHSTRRRTEVETVPPAVQKQVVWVLDKKILGERSSSEESILIPAEMMSREPNVTNEVAAGRPEKVAVPYSNDVQTGNKDTTVLDPIVAYKEVLDYWLSSTPGSMDADDVTAHPSPIMHDMLKTVEEGGAPYHALIYFRGHFACGGVILHNLWVLTAGSCVPDTNPELYKVYVGKTSKNERQSTEQLHLVTNVILHENYTSPRNGNDIALLLLQRPIEYNSFVQAAQLPRVDKEPMPGQALLLTGFGGKQSADPGSDSLLRTTIAAYISDWECEFVLSDNYSSKRILNIRPSQLCAIGMHGIANPGDPLVTKTTQTLVGIVSFKVPAPGKENYPIVYTQISHFMPWLGLKLAAETKLQNLPARMSPKNDVVY